MIDGTPCSYDHPSDICVQGKCIKMGCDKTLGSPVSEDSCGVCGGDGTKCQRRQRTFQGELGRRERSKKLLVLPQGARNITIHLKQGKVRGAVSQMDCCSTRFSSSKQRSS